MKKIAFAITILAGLGGAVVGYFNWTSSSDSESINLVPPDAIYFLQSDEPIPNWKEFSSSKFWSFLKTHPSLKELSDDADYLDQLLNENETALKHIGKRNFLISAHMIGNNDYDFISYIDLKDAAKFKLTKSILSNIAGDKSTKVYEHKHKGSSVFELLDKASNDVLYIVQIDKHLALSYSRMLIYKCLDHKQNESLSFDSKFIETSSETPSGGLCRIYLNYNHLSEFVGVYSKDGMKSIQNISEEFKFSGFRFTSNDDNVILDGYASIPDSVAYTNLLHKHGGGDVRFDQVLSHRTGYCQAILFKDFQSFYIDLEGSLDQLDQVKEFKDIQGKVERILNLSLNDDLLSWIGNEIVIAQNKPSAIHANSEDDLLIAIRTNSIEDAEAKLMKVQRQIKKRSPAKFKKLEYKNYNIFYLDINGFFGLFFGQAFDKITKPYYTIISDYVVFSNSPKTLASLIGDYENGATLSKNESFQNVKDNLPTETTLFSFVNGPNSYPIAKRLSNPQEQKAIKVNQPYFEFFDGIGISFSKESEGFDNKIYIHFEENDAAETENEIETDLLVDVTPNLSELTDAELFVLHEINNGVFEKYYPNTSITRIKAETKKGVFHGDYQEFYLSGKLKVEGNYRKGKKSGRWKYYSKDGKLQEKKWE